MLQCNDSNALLLFGSPVRSVVSEDEDDDLFPNSQRELNDDVILEWARVSLLFSHVFR